MKGTIQRRIRNLLIAGPLLTSLLTVLIQGNVAHAGHSACRTDPEVTLSNGDVVTIVADIGADASTVQGVTYTLHAPRGTTVTNVVYFGDVPANLEQLVFIADRDGTKYQSLTNVQTATNSITVAANTTVAAHSQQTYTHTSNGHTNQNVKVDLDAH